MRKVSKYPITDLIFEDDQESVRALWEKILGDILRIKEKSVEFNLNYHVYGNSWISVHFPFIRFLICSCGYRQDIKQWDWQLFNTEAAFH